jgi:acyl-CoA thioester hydrolase
MSDSDLVLDVFELPLTPRYMEVDQQGVVFNGWYLTWFDEAMTAWLDHRGIDYAGMIAQGLDVQNVHAELDYRKGVRWREQVHVAVSLARVGTKSFTLHFQVRRGAADRREACVDGAVVYALVAIDGSGARAIPDRLREALGEERPLRP